MADAKKGRFPGVLVVWLKKPAVWFGGLTLAAVGVLYTEWAKEQVRDLGGVASWLATPSTMPTWVAVLAGLVVVAFVALGVGCAAKWVVNRVWPRKASTASIQLPRPDPWSTFRGAIYWDRPWSWVGMDSVIGPGEVYPHCLTDGTRLVFDGPAGGGRRRYCCPDCRQCVGISDQDRRGINELVLRDVVTGDWEARFREYCGQLEKLAKESQAAPPPRTRAATRSSPPAASA